MFTQCILLLITCSFISHELNKIQQIIIISWHITFINLINPLPPKYIVYFRTNSTVGKIAIWLR